MTAAEKLEQLLGQTIEALSSLDEVRLLALADQARRYSTEAVIFPATPSLVRLQKSLEQTLTETRFHLGILCRLQNRQESQTWVR
jgi:hypothetical protein